MNRLLEPAWALLFLTSAVAGAQTPPAVMPPSGKPAAKSSAQIDAGEPRATSLSEPDAAPPAGARAAGGSTVPGGAAGSPAASAPKGSPAAARAQSAGPSPRAAAASARSAAGNGPRGAAAVDRLDLGTATVTGDQEQPKVMYVVPWKKADIGDLSGKPMNSLLDEALAPVDRDEFRREVAYFDAVRSDTSQSGASPSASKQGEK
jgi:hypothetical protein